METIKIRYGEGLSIMLETDDPMVEFAKIFVGKAGQIPLIEVEAPVVDGVATLTMLSADTRIPLGEYRYQVNLIHVDGQPEKYPDPEDCGACDDNESELPLFIVKEALDETEVIS